MDKKPKVVVFQPVESELARQTEQVKREMPYILELASVQAKVQVHRFNEYIKLGMTPEQALFLIK